MKKHIPYWVYGFSSADAYDTPAWFTTKNAALAFAKRCGWDSYTIEEKLGTDVDPEDIMDLVL